MSQESRLKANHEKPEDHVTDSTFYPNNSVMLSKGYKEKSNMIRLVLK